MKWDQIENNWAAMTRRVRPDLPMRAGSDATPEQTAEDADSAADRVEGVASTPLRHGA